MKFTNPGANGVFTIAATPLWPSIVFETDASGPHSWKWTGRWGSLEQSGEAQTPGNVWEAQSVFENYGGTLTVSATAETESVSILVTIKGTNPSIAEVTAYFQTKPGSAGFDKILKHESKCEHFTAQGEPLKSFDKGYGMCQLTRPVPSFGQVWNWKLNVDAGLALFAAKRASAITYLTQGNRTYTDDQLTREAVCRWNGGSYHIWDSAANAWVRNPNIVCDVTTGNIGWDMSDSENTGKTPAELHNRDHGSYCAPPGPGAHWRYSGICYADAVLG